MITTTQLKKLFPGAKSELVAAVVNGWGEAEKAGINTPKRVAAFLATIGAETGGLKILVENMNYTTTARIRQVWPSRFKTNASAQPFVKNPRALANKVYNGRMGNKPGSDDGYNYRGGGMFQTTGREGYREMGAENDPESLRKPPQAFSTAVREWTNRKCNKFADEGNIKGWRKAINGGYNGLEEATTYYNKALSIFSKVEPANASSRPLTGTAGVQEKLRDFTVKNVQQKLRDLGYPEVGDADGKTGTKTTAGILAFRADNGLPLTPAIDEQLLSALMTAKPREIAPARANATAKDLKPASSTIRTADKIKLGGFGLLGGGSILGGLDVVDAVQKARTIYDTVSDILPWVVVLGVGAVAVYYGYKIINNRVQAYREGKAL